MEHMTIDQLQYRTIVLHWLKKRYGDALAETIWKQTEENYAAYLKDLPDYGDMEAFVQRMKEQGYEDVWLIDTTRGSFMNRTEAALLDLSGSTLLVGRK